MSRRDSSLSHEQREAAVALFESGYGRDTVATSLGVSLSAVRRVHDRWRIWGRGTLVAKPTKQAYSFDFKCAVVQRFLAGDTRMALAQEYALASPELIERWVRIYRVEGADGLRPKPKGRLKRDPGALVGEQSELERLRQENERLRAEVAYLGKLKALMSRERR